MMRSIASSSSSLSASSSFKTYLPVDNENILFVDINILITTINTITIIIFFSTSRTSSN